MGANPICISKCAIAHRWVGVCQASTGRQEAGDEAVNTNSPYILPGLGLHLQNLADGVWWHLVCQSCHWVRGQITRPALTFLSVWRASRMLQYLPQLAVGWEVQLLNQSCLTQLCIPKLFVNSQDLLLPYRLQRLHHD